MFRKVSSFLLSLLSVLIAVRSKAFLDNRYQPVDNASRRFIHFISSFAIPILHLHNAAGAFFISSPTEPLLHLVDYLTFYIYIPLFTHSYWFHIHYGELAHAAAIPTALFWTMVPGSAPMELQYSFSYLTFFTFTISRALPIKTTSIVNS